MIILYKKNCRNKFKPFKLFETWFKAGTYCDEKLKNIENINEKYKLNSASKLQEFWYNLWYNYDE